ncbi:MAG: diaminopimelate epimerase [Thermomicrobiales bacterium]|nr:MAG: diaminopimelate epimerase [Thermomicrobiales bacterium]
MTAHNPTMRLPIDFMKLHGSGNDFVVIDNRAAVVPECDLHRFSELVTRRATSIGADGVVLIEPASEPDTDFRWRYFNADGSEGEMCGNGAMCGARFAALIGAADSEMAFSTMSGIVRARVDADSGQVELAMPDTGPVEPPRTVEAGETEYVLFPIQVGVPHAVLYVEDADAFGSRGDLERIGSHIRRSDAFMPAGTNVNVVSRLDGGRLRMRTYERGVEAETLACGTGAVASAVVSAAQGMVLSPVEIITSSGMPLVASFDLGENGARTVALRGQTRIVMSGEIRPDALAR